MNKNFINIELKKEYLYINYNNTFKTRLKLKNLLNKNTLDINYIFELKKEFFKNLNFKKIYVYFYKVFNTFLNNNNITKVILPKKTLDKLYIEANGINFKSCKLIFDEKTNYKFFSMDIENCYLNPNFFKNLKNIKLDSVELYLKIKNKFSLNLDYLNIDKNFSIVGNENLYIKGKFKNKMYKYIKIYNSNIVNNIFENIKNIKYLVIEDSISNPFKNKYLKFTTSFLKSISEIGLKIKIENLTLILNKNIKYNNTILIRNVRNIELKNFYSKKIYISNSQIVKLAQFNTNLTTIHNCGEIKIVDSKINYLELKNNNKITLNNVISKTTFIDKFQEINIYNNEENMNKIILNNGKNAKIKDTLLNNIHAYNINNLDLGLCSMEFLGQENKEWVNKSYKTVILNEIENLNFYLFYKYKLKNYEFNNINNLNIYILFEIEDCELLNYFLEFIVNTKTKNSKNIKIKSFKEFQYKSFYALIEKNKDLTKEIISLFQNLLRDKCVMNSGNFKRKIKEILIELLLKQKINLKIIKDVKLKNEPLFTKNEISKLNNKIFNSVLKI